jgi:cellulose synthase (UDP-forming)
MYAWICVLWVLVNVMFWGWWLQPEHISSSWLYIVFSLVWAYESTVLPSMYLYFVGHMRRPRHMPAPGGLRVALITLCVPSQESIDIIEAQLETMQRVSYPHDTWVLDEGNDPAVRAVASRLGVHYFTRNGIERYNQPSPPFQARTKAGNVNAWLDAHGANYTHFTQFDIDHRPNADYLDRVLGYFDDPEVAWVQAPSLYGNLDSWVARGAAEQELVLQGPLQRGFFGHSETPFIIGSHCTYRTSAIREIGGFQPTRAEDHLDTVVLASRAHRGVFVPEPLAWGDGPETFETYLRQQFAWALSMMQVLFTYTPRLLYTYTPRQAVQFLFAQTWYTLWSTSMFVLFCLPMLALLTGQSIAEVPLPLFMAATAPMGVMHLILWRWTRRWYMPVELGLSWRSIVLHIARWPIVFWALLNVLLRVRHPYMITPKGDRGGVPRFPMRAQLIYLVGVLMSLLAVLQYLVRDPDDRAAGYLLFALFDAVFMLLVVLVNVGAELRATARRGTGGLRLLTLRLVPLTTVLLFVLGLGCTAVGAAGTVQGTLRSGLPAPRPTPGGVLALGPDGASAGGPEVQVVLSTGLTAGLPAPRPSPSAALALAPEADSLPTREPVLASSTLAPAAVVPPSATAAPETLAIAQLLALGDGPLVWGAYDPHQAYVDVPLGIEHWYVRQDDPQALRGALAHAGKRLALITLEPYPRFRPGPVLDRLVAGTYDDDVRALARVARESGGPVLVRWGHEMDLSGLYPWAANRPDLYRAAFRHVVSVFRAEGATNVLWVWSPAGEPGASAYYPGADVVDYVGLTVLGDAEWDAGFGRPRQALSQLLAPRYVEVEGLGKPVLVAELGVSGSPDEQQAWLTAGLADIQAGAFPLLRGLVYFGDRNAENNRLAWQPDWQIAATTLQSIAQRG